MPKFSPITLGKRLTKIETGGFVLTETKHRPNLQLNPHSHRNANLVCVLRGSFVEIIGRRQFECTAHSLLLKPAGETHSNLYHRTGAHCLIIEILPELMSENRNLPEILRDVKFLQTVESFDIIRRIYREFGIADDLSEMSVEGLALELLTQFTRQTEKKVEPVKPLWLAHARDYIHANFNEQMSLTSVAEAVGIHASHLARVFRRKYHCSVGDYIRRLRLEFAADQLVKTDRPLAEISAQAGFYDQSHFTREFKLHVGVTPTEYRSDKN
ncbi:MAG: AraC family transcriptional regulator [Pyrinomonadaceae bacterium]